MIGGKNEERLFLFDHNLLNVRKTDMPNMEALISRHKARYNFAAFFARAGMRVLDFPCGSGYGSTLMPERITYVGMDYCPTTIEYAKHYYDNIDTSFYVDDLINPLRIGTGYDLIMCIDGIEHIDEMFQKPLIEVFYDALNSEGILFISTPEVQDLISGPSKVNPFHLWELTEKDFEKLMKHSFKDVQLFSKKETLHNATQTNNMFGVGVKEKSN